MVGVKRRVQQIAMGVCRFVSTHLLIGRCCEETLMSRKAMEVNFYAGRNE